jgi:thiamine kinase-like enzyme
LESIRRSDVDISPAHERLLGSLLDAMQRLCAEEPGRLKLLAEFGGRETFLHGDLWPKNIIVAPNPDGGYQPRLIDWDQASAGPISYDLSTFLYRFRPSERPWILELYRSAVAFHGWTLPRNEVLAELLETAEWARLANCIIWPAKDVLAHRADWPWQELELVEQWIRAAGPILPIARQA